MKQFLYLLLIPLFFSCSSKETKVQIKAMSFNIRYGTANDGENKWENRKHTVIRLIKESDADVIGLQEVLYFQWKELEAELGDIYQFVGKTRQAENKDEAALTLVKKAEWQVGKMEYFWLSETPEVSGSMSWNTVCPRICVRVELKHKASGKNLNFVNTHYSHVSDDARNRSSNMIRARFVEEVKSLPFILVGDLNAQPHEQAIKNIFKDKDLFSTYAESNNDKGATFYGWKEHDAELGIKIDYIIRNGFLNTLNSKVLNSKIDGRYPSDHNALISIMEF